MSGAPSRASRPKDQTTLILGTWTPEFSVYGLALASPGVISTGLPAANDPWAFPFRVNTAVEVRELLVANGSAAGGNVDMGIYTSAFVRLVSAGSTLGSGNSQLQILPIADTVIQPNVTYYLVLARDNNTANRQRSFSGSLTAGQNTLAGVFDSTTDAFPLPDPLTNMVAAATITQIPFMGFACRVVT